MNLGVQGIKSLLNKPDLGILIMRIGVAAVLMVNGWNKFSGGEEVLHAVGANIKYVGLDIGQNNAFTLFFGIAAAGSELIGSMLLVVGFLFRISSAMLVFTMLVATSYQYQVSQGDLGKFGFPMVLFLVLLGLLFTGPLKFSIQRD